jgi:hypothetical protein
MSKMEASISCCDPPNDDIIGGGFMGGRPPPAPTVMRGGMTGASSRGSAIEGAFARRNVRAGDWSWWDWTRQCWAECYERSALTSSPPVLTGRLDRRLSPIDKREGSWRSRAV